MLKIQHKNFNTNTKCFLLCIARVSNYGNVCLELWSSALKTGFSGDCDDAVFPTRGVREKPSNAHEHLPLGTYLSKCTHSIPMIQSIYCEK